MNKTYIDKLAFIDLKDQKILMTRSKGKDTWYIPGGKRESGETDEQALAREVKEELSVDIDPSTISRYGVFEAQAHGKPEGTIVRMTCYLAKYLGAVTSGAEIEEIAWFEHSQKGLSSVVDNLIFDDLLAKKLIA